MELEHEFRVPVPVAQAWDVLLDVERIAPCMPGATVESFDGETIVGRVKVKVGPIQVTYAGTAQVQREGRGGLARRHRGQRQGGPRVSGTANATITAQLHDDGGSATNVTVTTDLAITGKPAQFGRGVMVEVGNKLLGRFADCLAGELGSCAPRRAAAADRSPRGALPRAGRRVGARTAGGSRRPTAGHRRRRPGRRPSPTPIRRTENEAIDLLDTARSAGAQAAGTGGRRAARPAGALAAGRATPLTTAVRR